MTTDDRTVVEVVRATLRELATALPMALDGSHDCLPHQVRATLRALATALPMALDGRS